MGKSPAPREAVPPGATGHCHVPLRRGLIFWTDGVSGALLEPRPVLTPYLPQPPADLSQRRAG